jgi:hypothetical protein
MSMRFRPAYISVINRRANSPAVIGAAGGKDSSRLTSGNVFPLRRPSGFAGNAGTVLTVKGSLRRANNGAPWTAPRRSGLSHFAMGGSGGNTHPSLNKNQDSTPHIEVSLTQSLHISSRSVVLHDR